MVEMHTREMWADERVAITNATHAACSNHLSFSTAFVAPACITGWAFIASDFTMSSPPHIVDQQHLARNR